MCSDGEDDCPKLHSPPDSDDEYEDFMLANWRPPLAPSRGPSADQESVLPPARKRARATKLPSDKREAAPGVSLSDGSDDDSQLMPRPPLAPSRGPSADQESVLPPARKRASATKLPADKREAAPGVNLSDGSDDDSQLMPRQPLAPSRGVSSAGAPPLQERRSVHAFSFASHQCRNGDCCGEAAPVDGLATCIDGTAAGEPPPHPPSDSIGATSVLGVRTGDQLSSREPATPNASAVVHPTPMSGMFSNILPRASLVSSPMEQFRRVGRQKLEKALFKGNSKQVSSVEEAEMRSVSSLLKATTWCAPGSAVLDGSQCSVLDFAKHRNTPPSRILTEDGLAKEVRVLSCLVEEDGEEWGGAAVGS